MEAGLLPLAVHLDALGRMFAIRVAAPTDLLHAVAILALAVSGLVCLFLLHWHLPVDEGDPLFLTSYGHKPDRRRYRGLLISRTASFMALSGWKLQPRYIW